MYINIHSHQPPKKNECAIQNLYKDFEKAENIRGCSIGLHPWYINDSWRLEMQQLKRISISKNVLAIGECGLDKICDVEFDLQQEVFVQQIKMANEIKKPLIIHCVKAYEEVLMLLKKEKASVPVIFHGFNKNKIIADKITESGYYLSFGKALQNPTTAAVIAAVPADRIFLETDDADISIEEVYHLAATACSIDEASLILQIQKNAAAVFGADTFKQ